MTKLVCLIVGFALVLAAPPCFADPPDAELARLRAEIAKLRRENAALREQLQDLGPLLSDFRGVLKERSDTFYFPPPFVGSRTSPELQNTWLVIDLDKKGGSYSLLFKGPEEYRQALSWKGKQVVVRGSVKTVPRNPFAREVLMPPPSGFSGTSPPTREILPVLVVESVKPVKGAGRAMGDQEKLQGTWRVAGLGADGVRFRDGHQQIKDAKVVITGNRATVTGNSLTLVGPAHQEKEKSFDLTLDLSKTPREIQFSNNSEVLWAIYQLDGDDLKLCFLRDGEAKVPTDFTVTSGSKRWLYVLIRERPDQGEDRKR